MTEDLKEVIYIAFGKAAKEREKAPTGVTEH